MAEFDRLRHLKIGSFFEPNTYSYPHPVQIDFPIAQKNRTIHGNALLQQLSAIKEHFKISAESPLPQNIIRDDALYVEFFSEINFPLKFESLHQEQDNPQYQILNISAEKQNEEGDLRYRVVVMMTEGGVSSFIKKIRKYLTANIKDRQGNITDRPSNMALVNNIAHIQLATLESFWVDGPEIPFPNPDEIIWWEVWFRRTNSDGVRLENVFHNLSEIGAQISPQTLEFPEHRVRLVRASARQLSSSLLLLDNLAELRKPQEISDFVAARNVDFVQKQQWLNDLLSRTDTNISNNSVVVCLLDSGVNNQHPLITNFLPNDKLYTYKEAWGTNDTWSGGGHGTAMAGLSIYGDLTDAFGTSDRIRIFHSLESFKIIYPADPNDPNLYGSITEYACSAPLVDFPNNPRLYCLAITDNELAFYGRPSSWSSAIDKIAFGNNYEPQMQQLIIVSSGNVDYITSGSNPNDYPNKNSLESVHDPAQAYNALTVGSYTRMDRIDQNIWQGFHPLAPYGGMSPSNSTSLIWDSQWPIKPDIVLEGGNLAVENLQLRDDVNSLKPLSLDKDFANFIFMPFGDTSGAAALGAKMAAELMNNYPEFWPETLRGLIVHSADWTTSMLNNLSFPQASVSSKRSLLRTFGYGVPILEKALYSASNVLTLIAENEIQPYILTDSSVKYHQYHLYSIPWPTDILRDLIAEADVKFAVTLSYFIEPNPGSRRYANNFHYHSHSLDFKVIKPTESLSTFRRRVSAYVEQEESLNYEGTGEPWFLKEIVRSKGSLKKDFIICSGADLAPRNVLAVFPKAGWYKSRRKLGKFNSVVRYSLIITIETERTDIDLYTPVLNQLEIEIPAV